MASTQVVFVIMQVKITAVTLHLNAILLVVSYITAFIDNSEKISLGAIIQFMVIYMITLLMTIGRS
jgi:hypothetical protein